MAIRALCRFFFTTPATLFLALALVPLVSAYVASPTEGCPNPPKDCTAYVTSLAAPTASHGACPPPEGSPSPGCDDSGGEAEVIWSSSEKFPMEYTNGWARLVATGASLDNESSLMLHPGATGEFRISFSAEDETYLNDSLVLRVMVDPAVPGLHWTGPIEANLTVNSTLKPYAAFPFRISPGEAPAHPGLLKVPFYVITHDGDPNNSTLGADSLSVRVVANSTPASSIPFPGAGAMGMLLLAALLAVRRKEPAP